MDTAIALALAYYGTAAYRNSEKQNTVRARQELRTRAGQNIITREGAAAWGNNYGPIVKSRWHATYEPGTLMNYAAYDGKPGNVDAKKVRRVGALREDLERITALEVPHTTGRGSTIGSSRLYPPTTNRELALRRVGFRPSALPGSGRQGHFLASRKGKFILPSN